MKKLIFATILTLSLASVVHAGNYAKIDENDSTVLYLEKSSMTKENDPQLGVTVAFTTKVDFYPGKGASLGPKFKSAKSIVTRYVGICDGAKYMQRWVKVYNTQGKIIHQEGKGNPDVATEGTYIWSAMAAACDDGSNAKADGWQ